MAKHKTATTIRLSDTIDQYARRVHVNVLNGKVTLVYRWKDSKSPKSHIQRMTLDDDQAGRLTGALFKAFRSAAFEDVARAQKFTEQMGNTMSEAL